MPTKPASASLSTPLRHIFWVLARVQGDGWDGLVLPGSNEASVPGPADRCPLSHSHSTIPRGPSSRLPTAIQRYLSCLLSPQTPFVKTSAAPPPSFLCSQSCSVSRFFVPCGRPSYVGFVRPVCQSKHATSGGSHQSTLGRNNSSPHFPPASQRTVPEN